MHTICTSLYGTEQRAEPISLPNVISRKPPRPSGLPISFIKISPKLLNTITNGKSGSIPGTLKLVTVLSSLMAIAPTAPAALQFWNLRRYPQPVVLTRQYFPLISRALRIFPHADPTIVCGGSFRPGLAIAPSRSHWLHRRMVSLVVRYGGMGLFAAGSQLDTSLKSQI